MSQTNLDWASVLHNYAKPSRALIEELHFNPSRIVQWGTVLSDSFFDMESISPFISSSPAPRYAPPWQDLSIIGIAGSSGSGKTSVAMEIVKSLNLPWVVILVMVQLLKMHGLDLVAALTFICLGFILQDIISRGAPQSSCERV
jgi:hypothetical protein